MTLFAARYGWLVAALMTALIGAALLGLVLGKYPLSLSQVLHSLYTLGQSNEPADLVIWNLRIEYIPS